MTQTHGVFFRRQDTRHTEAMEGDTRTDTHKNLVSPPPPFTLPHRLHAKNSDITLPSFQRAPMGGMEKTNDWCNHHAASTARRLMPREQANSYVKEIQ